MKTGENKRFYIIISVVLMLTLTVIWGHSFMPAESSSKESGSIFAFLKPILDFIFGEDMSTEYLLRKLGHFTEFMVLGAELLILMRRILINGKQYETDSAKEKGQDSIRCSKGRAVYAMVNAWAAATICGLIDETIQIFSPGRSSQVTDVWIDSSGCLAGALIATIVCILIQKRKLKKRI